MSNIEHLPFAGSDGDEVLRRDDDSGESSKTAVYHYADITGFDPNRYGQPAWQSPDLG